MKIAGLYPTRLKQDLEIDLSCEQPLGIAYVMAGAQKAGHDVNLYYGNTNLETIISSDILALSLLIFMTVFYKERQAALANPIDNLRQE